MGRIVLPMRTAYGILGLDAFQLPRYRVRTRWESSEIRPSVSDENVGQGAVLGSEWTGEFEDTVGWGRNAENGNEVSKQDDPKDEKF